MPSSGVVLLPLSASINSYLRQPKAPLRDQTALNFVGPDADDPHQRMAQVLLEPAVVEGARHLLGKCGAHAENIERGFAEALHQFAGKYLADRAIFRRRDPVGREFRAMHHQLTTDLDFAGEGRHPVTDERIIDRAAARRSPAPGHVCATARKRARP